MFLPVYLNRGNIAVMFEDEGFQSVGLNKGIKLQINDWTSAHF